MNLNKKIYLPFYLIVILILLIIFFLFNSWRLSRLNEDDSIFVNKNLKSGDSKYKFISPLLDCADTKIYPSQYNNLKKKIEDLVEKELFENKAQEISIYFRDLNNGPWLGYNEDEKFSPASLMKVPILIAYLKIAETNPNILKELKNSGPERIVLDQNIKPLKKIEADTDYTILELIEYMIIYSDNVATEILIENISGEVLNKIYNDLGIVMPENELAENFINVKDYSSFFRVLYNASYLNREMSELALNILSYSFYKDALAAGVPKNVPVAHKFGERGLLEGKQLHDCGIIYKDGSDYLLCVMTRGSDFNEMKNVIYDISKLVYENFNPTVK